MIKKNVTGAGSGIGKLMAKKFAKLGARMILLDVNERENDKTANEILVDGGNAQAVILFHLMPYLNKTNL